MKENKNLMPIPVVGEFYHFFDDGKSSVGRHYIAKCEEIISLDLAKEMIIEIDKDECSSIETSLYNCWIKNKEHCDFLYAENTDCIVKCSIPKYDDEPIYFVRTVDGGWFSMDVTNDWQSGRLDVTGEKYNSIIKFYEEDKEYDNTEILEAYKSTTY